MKLKQKPEDFIVKESYRFDESPKGEYRVYLMDKQKLSTFDAISRMAVELKLPKSAFSYCGLKDKQGRTEQIIAVKGANIDVQDEDLRLKFLGRTAHPLSAKNTTSNRFGVTVRELSEDDVARIPGAIAEVNRVGVVNYFDSQRFGSLKHGQGFIAKDLIRGDFEMALKNFLAKPSELDRTNDAKVKAFWRDHWGAWRRKCTIPGAEKYDAIIEVLRKQPKDFREAFLRIDPKYRAMQLFTYQSFLWNEGVRRLLMALCPGQSLIALNYQAGKLLFPRDASSQVIEKLRDLKFPLLGPDTKFEDPDVKSAMEWILGREKLTVEQLVVPNTPEIFFKHELRPVVVYPGKLLVGAPHPDELNRESDAKKVYLAFTLPPGSYATLVVRRVFSFTEQMNDVYSAEDAKAIAEARATRNAALQKEEDGDDDEAPIVRRPPTPATSHKEEPQQDSGFRARQKAKKEKKALAQIESEKRKAAKAKGRK